MKVKPKSLLVNLPIVLTFPDYHDIPRFAADINSIVHGKVKVKCEELGLLGSEYVGIFYLQRNPEYQELRQEFMKMIEKEERENYGNDQV
jgi:hypothetical protein